MLTRPADKQPYHTWADDVPFDRLNVHHNRSICPLGLCVEERNLEYGTGNKPLCDWCKAHPVLFGP